MTRLNKLAHDGLIPNNLFCGVVKTNEAFVKLIDEALTGKFERFASQA
jgi:hypothetical protein